MKAIQKKVLLSGLIVVFAFIVTIGSTFAWFTVGQSADVQEMNLTINSSESILILLDEGYDPVEDATFLNTPQNYKSILTNADFVGVYDITDINIAMEPLTSVNGTAITTRSGGTARFTTDGGDPTLLGQYVEFNVWLLSQSQTVSIALADFTVTADNAVTNKNIVVDALRMSLTSTAATNNVRIFGYDRDYGFEFLEGQVGYSSTASENEIDSTVATTLTGLHGVYYTLGATEVGESTNTKLDASQLFILVANTPTKVTIRIWIEGWDAQANNNLVAAIFDIAFNFIVREVIT